MNTARIARHTSLTLLSSLMFVAACNDSDLPTAGEFFEEPSTTRAPSLPGGEPLKILTRNLYMGGDVGLVFGADLTDPVAVAQAATAIWGQIQANRFSERAAALVDEIAEAHPHVVGIQEVPQYIVLNSSYQPVEVQDYLSILLAEMDGLPYELATVQENTITVMPVYLSTGLHYVRFADRIAVLIRTDLDVTGVEQGTYAAHYPLAEGLDLRRGWIRTSADIGGVPYHFVNTHPEVQTFAPIQVLQAQELLEGVMAGLDGVTIVSGDLNSDAEAGPGIPSWTPTYETLIAAGFQDSWQMAHPGRHDVGFTCCQDKDLLNPTSDLEERIDFVLIRSDPHMGSDNRFPGSIHAEIIGEEPGDRTHPTGLWPSDHAGLLASLKLPTGIFNAH
jgi:endonuclease/exonuclease/phosphatase family metal-dependent hydrolase